VTERLPVQDWMTASATRRVFAALEARGGADCARFVGGCVRNAVLGRPVDDLDIATTLTPEQATEALRAAGVRVVPTGVEHGTVTAVADHRPFEITTLRRDVETDGRRAVVAFTTDWAEDAARRDFRLNALYADLDGRLFDPTGGGLADARAGRIVFVGDPQVRIREDYLRILRFFRFYAWFGRGAPDEAGLKACGALSEGLTRISAERVQKELLKLLAAEDPRAAVRLMAGAGVLAVAAPAAVDVDRFAALVRIEREILGEADPELRLAALLPADPALARAAAEALRLSNAQRDRLEAAAGSAPAIDAATTAPQMRRAVYRLGGQAFRDRLELAWACDPDPGRAAAWRALLDAARGWRAPAFPLGGEDAMKLGAPRGPAVGRALREVEDWWVQADFPADADQLRSRLQAAVRRAMG
jgi:poly(A) polymerase